MSSEPGNVELAPPDDRLPLEAFVLVPPIQKSNRFLKEMASGHRPSSTAKLEVSSFNKVPEDDRYLVDVLHPLGSGAFGDVYKAFDQKLGIDVAIKFFEPKKKDSIDLEDLDRMELEAKAMTRIESPHIVRIYGLLLATNYKGNMETPAIVMELMDPQKTLWTEIKEDNISTEEIKSYVYQLSSVIDLLDKNRIYHQDLKPSNIFVVNGGYLKVSDFGISSPISRFASNGVFMGTPAYVAPEIIQGAPASNSSEIFSLGVMTYEMFCATTPLDNIPQKNENTGNIHINGILNNPVLSGYLETELKKRKIKNISAVVKVLDKALSAHPLDRQESALEFSGELDKALDLP